MADEEIKVKATPINQVEIKGAIAFSAEHARVWAEGTDEEVEKLGGEHSAKVWSRIVPDEAKKYTDEQIALSKTELTGQINTAAQGAVQTANAYSDTQLDEEESARQNADASLQNQIDELNLTDLNDVAVSSPSAAQVLAYDATTQKWKNSSSTASVAWGAVTGTLSNQTDLLTALNAKADDSDLNSYVAKTGSTMTGDLSITKEYASVNLTNSNNKKYAVMANENGNLDIKLDSSNGKGLFLNGQDNEAPYYNDGTNAYRLLNTTDKTTLETSIAGKANTDLSNVPASKSILVESYVNGTSWYRVYSDGWCEQGGYVDSGEGSVDSGSQVTFLKEFVNTNYTITFLSGHTDTSTNTVAVQYGNYYYGCYYPSSKSTTGIMLRGQGTWKAEGYIS